MAEATVVSGDSPEAVAYALFVGIATKQGKLYSAAGTPVASADLEWVLQTYEKCLRVVKGEGVGMVT